MPVKFLPSTDRWSSFGTSSFVMYQAVRSRLVASLSTSKPLKYSLVYMAVSVCNITTMNMNERMNK